MIKISVSSIENLIDFPNVFLLKNLIHSNLVGHNLKFRDTDE